MKHEQEKEIIHERKFLLQRHNLLRFLPDKEDDILFHLNKRAESMKNSRKKEKEEEKR